MNLSLNAAAPPFPTGTGLLRDLVHERTGLYFDDVRLDLFFSKISPLIRARDCGSLLDYYYVLKYDPASAEEWLKVFDALTVQESFFWREMDQVRALVDHIVPRYFDEHPHHTLNIWSAACAGGQEPLTIAMALLEAGWFDREKIEIYASDASPRAIETARAGTYRERSFRNLPLELREKYFVCPSGGVGSLLHASSELHSRVHWRLANLMSEDDLGLFHMTAPVIFCRNVFMYFSENAIRKTVRLFAERMPRPSYLFVGTAESLTKTTSEFELREIGEALVYVRE